MIFDWNQTLSHLQSLGYKDGDTVNLRAFMPERSADDYGRKSSFVMPRLPSFEISRWMEEGRGVYLVVNKGGHKDVNISDCSAIFYEHDDLDKDLSKWLWQTLGLPEPSLQVDTGGKSIHSYWVFNYPVPPQKWKPLQIDLLEFSDGDRKLKNPSRVMRLAGCLHAKSGQMSKIVGGCQKRYSYEDLREIIPIKTVEVKEKPEWSNYENLRVPIPEAVPLYNCISHKSRDLINLGVGEGGRNDSGAALARDLIGASNALKGMGQAFEGDPRLMLEEYGLKCSPPLPAQEIDAIWKSAESSNPSASLSYSSIESCVKAWAYRKEKNSIPVELQAEIEVIENPNYQAEKIASKHQSEEPPDYDLTLDEVDKLETAEPDSSKLHWLLSNYAYDGGLKKRGFSADYLLRQAQARRDRDGVMEGYTTRQILEMYPKRNWIVGGLIPARSVVILAATGGIGKTSLIYDVEKAISLGYEWCEMPVARGSVMNIQVDEPLSDTADKLREGMFYDIPDEAITWYDKWRFTQTKQLFQKIEEQRPSLVVIDSITAAHAGTGTDMISSTAGDCIYKLRDYVTRCDWDISFWLVHHMSKGGTMRDSSTFKDNASEIQLLYKPTDDESLAKNEYVLEFEKSRAGLTGKYVMEKDIANYRWIYKGLKDAPTAFYHMLRHLKKNPHSKFSPKRLSDDLSISYEAAHANLELARRFCLIESELQIHEAHDGRSHRFRLYWGRSTRLHPEIAEVVPRYEEEIDWR